MTVKRHSCALDKHTPACTCSSEVYLLHLFRTCPKIRRLLAVVCRNSNLCASAVTQNQLRCVMSDDVCCLYLYCTESTSILSLCFPCRSSKVACNKKHAAQHSHCLMPEALCCQQQQATPSAALPDRCGSPWWPDKPQQHQAQPCGVPCGL